MGSYCANESFLPSPKLHFIYIKKRKVTIIFILGRIIGGGEELFCLRIFKMVIYVREIMHSNYVGKHPMPVKGRL